ncbi:hypothetical protein GMRT_25198 [Giardia muris]|uniref:Uncharacterized protein n=1 Tax=Giardia muris TaxID=5742 RepID=A0A4Z1SWL1_GIAMU|nr:hypothetical protein GMRT_25198 [Giardia muris]|eukprot:TNJ26123.1 hypothetical protein GMRT_25198 [Giardia muris]
MESTTLKQDDKISHLRTENASLQEQLSSSKKAQEEAEERLSQMNQEMSSSKPSSPRPTRRRTPSTNSSRTGNDGTGLRSIS